MFKGGRKFWGLAPTGQNTSLKGKDLDNGYLPLAISCASILAIRTTPTTVWAVCNNTPSIAVDGATRAIKVPHNTRFDPQQIKKRFGITIQWDDFFFRIRTLAECKAKSKEVVSFITIVLGDTRPAK